MKTHFEKVNREFKNFTSYFAIETGIEPAIARNIVRWHLGQRPKTVSSRVWTDPKTGSPLTVEQWTGPAERLRNKVLHGTQSGDPLPEMTYEEKWNDAVTNGMIEATCGRLITEDDLFDAVEQEFLELE